MEAGRRRVIWFGVGDGVEFGVRNSVHAGGVRAGGRLSAHEHGSRCTLPPPDPAPLPSAPVYALPPPKKRHSQSPLISDTVRMNSLEVSTSSWYTTHFGSASRRLELG